MHTRSCSPPTSACAVTELIEQRVLPTQMAVAPDGGLLMMSTQGRGDANAYSLQVDGKPIAAQRKLIALNLWGMLPQGDAAGPFSVIATPSNQRAPVQAATMTFASNLPKQATPKLVAAHASKFTQPTIGKASSWVETCSNGKPHCLTMLLP